jgi:hypothetical protein
MIKKISTAQSDSNHLKNVFEQSLAVLSEDADAGVERKNRRSLPLHMDAANLQKRALENAANALANLWKIPCGRVKPRTA